MLYRVEGDIEEREGEIEDSFAKEFSVADTFYKSILTIKIRPSYSAYTIYVHLVEPRLEKTSFCGGGKTKGTGELHLCADWPAP